VDAVIYWFSGTGNSLAIARALAQELPGARLVPVARAVREQPPAARCVGVVFPVYYFGPPPLVAEFLSRLPAAFPAPSCGSAAWNWPRDGR